MKNNNFAIVGAGIIGRLLAYRLVQEGAQVTLYEQELPDAFHTCSFTCAGMLAPVFERDVASKLVASMGRASLKLWQDYASAWENKVFTQFNGTLAVAYHQDLPELENLRQRLGQTEVADQIKKISLDQILELEPELGSRFSQGLFVPDEGQVSVFEVLLYLYEYLSSQPRAHLKFSCEVKNILPHQVITKTETKNFDLVFDCRGLGAKQDLQNLRGVRGEIMRLEAPEVHLNRPIRFLHPRYPLYVIPRRDFYLIGSTSIQSDDLKPVTVRSALELLSAAFAVHPGFAEATILEMKTQCRPAFPDNEPRILCQDGLMRLNGFYRHGALISPQLIEWVVAYLKEQVIPLLAEPLFSAERLAHVS